MSITYNWRWLTGLEQVVGLTLGVVNSATRQANRLAMQTAIDAAIADGTNTVFLPSGRVEFEFTNSSTDYRFNVTDDLIVQGCGMNETILAYTSSTHFVYYGFHVSAAGDLTVNDLTMERMDAGEDPAGGTQGYTSALVYAVSYATNVPGDLILNNVKSSGEWMAALNNSGNVDTTMTLNGCYFDSWGQSVQLFDTGGLSDRRLHVTDTYFHSANTLGDPLVHHVYAHPHVSVRMTRVRFGPLSAGYAVHHFSESGVPPGAAPKYVQYTDCVLEEDVSRGFIVPRGSFAEFKGLTSRTQGVAIYAYNSVNIQNSTFWGPALEPGVNFDATDVITSIGNTFFGFRYPFTFGAVTAQLRSIGDRFFGSAPAVVSTAGSDIQIDNGWWQAQTEHLVSVTNGVATFTLPTHARAYGSNDLANSTLTINDVAYTVSSNTSSVVTLTANYAGSTSAVAKAKWTSFQKAVDINGTGGKLRVNRGRLIGTVTSSNGPFYVDSASTSVFEINNTVFELTGDTNNIRSNGAGIARGRGNTFSGAYPLQANSSGAEYGFIEFNSAVSPTAIASATTIENLSTHYNVYHVSGTTTVNKIMWADNAAYQRMMAGKVTLIANNASGFTLNDDSVSSGNIRLRTGSTLALTQWQSVTLVYDPVTAFWYQV